MADTFVSVDSGPLQGRVHIATGRIEFRGPDRAGAPQGISLNLGPASAAVNGQKWTIGQVAASSAAPGQADLVQKFGANQVRTRLSFVLPSVMRYEVVDWQGHEPEETFLSGDVRADEHFFGFGEKFNSLDQTGRVVEILTFDAPGNKGDRSYKVAPWFVSTLGYGFHFDSTARSKFDMRTSANGRFAVENFGGTLGFNVVHGPALTDVVARYTELTGRPSLPPPFAFGAWISSDVWRNGGEVRYAVSMFRERGIPVSCFVFDSPWEVAYNDFKFNIGPASATQFGQSGRFEDNTFEGFESLSDMMTFFRKNGLKVICWMTPFINDASVDEGIAGQNRGRATLKDQRDEFFVQDHRTGKPLSVKWWKGRGRPVDFTHPEARQWLADRLRDLVADSVVDTASGKEPAIGGFKTDDGEFGNGENTYIPPPARYHNGQTARGFVNGYCLEYHRCISSVLGANGVLFARSGFTGSQQFSGCWAGDNEPNFGDENGLPSVIIAGLSAAMCGYSVWGHDIGGYLNSNFSPVSLADLFMRWSQFGCFSPIMQMHRQVDSNNLRQYPWGYATTGETIDENAALDNYRFYAALHMRLFPYLYSYAKQSAETGLPILRPLVLMHADDANTFRVRHTYYFGGEMIVAPIIRPKVTQRDVYLPDGDWFDFWTNERHVGGQVVTWRNPSLPVVPASKAPVFMRSPSIVPMTLRSDAATLCDPDYVNNPAVASWDNNLEIRVYPTASSQFQMYEGTVISCATNGNTVGVTLESSSARRVVFRVHTSKPDEVRLNGNLMRPLTSLAAFDSAESGWHFESTFQSLLVKLQTSGTREHLVF
jgi:alpha-D-xyloside xylohydrolase